jgi:predicted enzyme related to lactoylglutathione lyase
MAQAVATLLNRPAWVDLASSDASAARDFYGQLFGWNIEVNPDPQYGGYAIANVGAHQAAGIGPTQSPEQPTAWSLYIGTDDVDALAAKVPGAGGTVIAAPFDVGDQGRMATFADPSGAMISAWQAASMRPFRAGDSKTFAWAELNARGLKAAIPFYERLFGWTSSTSEYGEGLEYTQFAVDGQNILGALEMSPEIPAATPSYWMVYFAIDDLDAAFKKATDLGAKEMVAPSEIPGGGRFAILSDPQGAMFGLMTVQSGS